jgi:hypothetical protein
MTNRKTYAQLKAEGRARCTACGKIVTLTHKTKAHPEGARLHSHVNTRSRNCWGSPDREDNV